MEMSIAPQQAFPAFNSFNSSGKSFKVAFRPFVFETWDWSSSRQTF